MLVVFIPSGWSGAADASVEDALPASPAPGLTVPRPVPLSRRRVAAIWAPISQRVDARAAPSRMAPVVVPVESQTPEGTTNIVLVVGRTRDRSGRLWAHVLLPGLPGRAKGWIPRAALGGYTFVTTHLVVDLERLTASLYDAGRRVFAARVGIGRPESPTPKGAFYVRNRLTRYSSPFYGPLAFGTSARSSVLTDWPGGGFIGIHGTDSPGLLPGRVSHGCIRMRNHDILELGRLMPVGTPVTIR